jgi:hypothetical protein
VGFGLQLASNSNNATVAATNQGNHDGSSNHDKTPCKSLSVTSTCLSAKKIVLGSSVKDTAIVNGLCDAKTPKGFVDFEVSSDCGHSWTIYDPCEPLVCGKAVSTSYTPISVGNYEFRALYKGDNNFYQSQSCLVRLIVEKASTTTATVIGATNVVEGQGITDNATVTGLGTGFPTPTGMVDFQVSIDNGTWNVYDANVLLVNGMATTAFYTPSENGYYSFQAVYHGDCNYLGSMSECGSEILMVTEVTVVLPPQDDSSTTVTQLSADQIVLGNSVTDCATVTGGEGMDLSGNVTFQVSFNEGAWMNIGENVTLVDGMATSASYLPAIAGNYEFRAIYNGNNDVKPSMSEEDSEPLLVTPADSNTATCLSQTSIKLGASVFDKATVTGLEGFPMPTGCVTFSVSSDCGKTWTQLGNSVSLIDGTATSVCFTPSEAVNYEFKAVYSGDSNYLSSTSCPHSEILKVTGEFRCITLGQSVQDNATVAGLGGDFPNPTGSVDFQVRYENGCWTTFSANKVLVNSEAISCFYTPLAAGHYNFRAVYSGDSNYVCSVSGINEEPLDVSPAASTTSTLLSSDSIVLGNSVYDTVKVTGLGGLFPVPTGKATFMVQFNEGEWMIYDANVTLVNGAATSTCYVPMAAGNYEFKAVFSGDHNYTCSMSGEDDEPLLVDPAASTTSTLLSSDSIVLGNTVCDSVKVTGLCGFPIPSGKVTFSVQFNEGKWTIYDADVSLVNGAATSVAYKPMAAGNYEFKASYSGDSNYVCSVSGENDEPLLVDPAATTTTTTLSQDTIVFGNSVQDKAFVTGLGCGFPTPTGLVDFQVSKDNGCSWTTYSSCVPLCNGVATSICYTPQTAGTYWFQAVYNGDVNYLGSQSDSLSEKLCVERAPSFTYTSLGTDKIVLGQSVRDNVTVVGLSGFVVPTGPVEFQVSLNNGTWNTYSYGTLDCNGQAISGWYTPLCTGHYEFRVVYSCDSNYLESTSCAHSEPLSVDKAQSTTTTDLGF